MNDGIICFHFICMWWQFIWSEYTGRLLPQSNCMAHSLLDEKVGRSFSTLTSSNEQVLLIRHITTSSKFDSELYLVSGRPIVSCDGLDIESQRKIFKQKLNYRCIMLNSFINCLSKCHILHVSFPSCNPSISITVIFYLSTIKKKKKLFS